MLVRVLAAAIVVGSWGLFGSGTPAARAQGCHSAERPVLGIGSSWESGLVALPEILSGIIEIRLVPPPALRKLPCSGETPGSTYFGLSHVPALVSFTGTFSPPDPNAALSPTDSTVSPHQPADPLDRPPRA